MSEPVQHSVHVAENGQSAFAVNIMAGGHALQGDEPESMGGANTAPSPYDFLTTALATCTVMTMRWYARQKSWPLERTEAVVTHEKRDGKDHFTKKLVVIGAALTHEQRAKLLDVAGKCPVQRTLQSDMIIETLWQEQTD